MLVGEATKFPLRYSLGACDEFNKALMVVRNRAIIPEHHWQYSDRGLVDVEIGGPPANGSLHS